MKVQNVLSSHLSFLVLVLSLLAVSVYSQSNQYCPLCATYSDLPKRWDYRLSDGRTCRDVYLYLAGISLSNSMCQTTKNMAQEACCSATAPPQTGGGSSPTPPPYSGPIGNEPICPICTTMEYPGIPQAFVVARYVGQFTCHQLYGRGLHGMIPNYMCGPLQDFAKIVCGCGPYNPNCKADPKKCWGSSPVASPVASPVQSPTARPTAKTRAPSRYSLTSYTLRGGTRRNEETDHLEEVLEEPIEAQDVDFHFEARMPTDSEEHQGLV